MADQQNLFEQITKRYDTHMDYGITMYDELPYKRDSDVCNASSAAMYSGHVIKYYSCKNQEENYVIQNHDDEIEEYLDVLRNEQIQTEILPAEEIDVDDPSNQITEEQIQSLLEDPEQENTSEQE